VGTAGSTTCLRCGTSRTAGDDDDARRIPGPCPSCGFEPAPQLTAELDYLDELETWIGVRRAELAAAARSPEPASTPAYAAPVAVAPAHPVRSRPSAAGVLLTVGAFALVAAGLAFTAVAWDLLGPLGQLLVLVVVGAGALAAGWLMAGRIPGTANALSVTGVLLLVVAAGFLLSSGSAGPPWVRAGAVAVAGCAGVALGYHQTARQRGAAVVTTSFFAGLATTALALAPWLEAPEPTGAGWWLCAVLLVAGAAMLGLERLRTRIATPPVPWAGLATTALTLGTLAGAVTAADRLDRLMSAVPAPVAAGAILLVGGAALALVGRWIQRWSPWIGSLLLVAISALLLLGALGEPPQRLWYAGLAVLLATVLALLAALVDPVGDRPVQGLRHLVRVTSERLATAAVGAAAALAMAWGAAAPLATCTGWYDEFCVDASTTAWLRDLHPWWSGVLVGAAAAVLAGIAVVALRRASRRAPDLPLVAAASLLLGWIALVSSDSSMRGADPDVVVPATAAALVLGGLGTLLVLALARWSTWTLWPAAATASVGVLVGANGHVLVGAAPAPELLGVLLAVPLALAGYLTYRRAGPTTSSWATIGPALCVALAPSVVRVVGDTLDRSLGGGAVQTGSVVREIAVLAAGVLLAAAGARTHRSAVFWPGVAVVSAVVAVTLVDVSTEVPQWVWLSVAGALLMLVGARWEWARRQGHRTREWSATLR
jgi:hypothetical protein